MNQAEAPEPKKRNAPAATRAFQKRLIGEQVMGNSTQAAAGVKSAGSVWISEDGHHSAYRNLLAIRALGEVFESGASESMEIGAVIELGSLIVRMANEASSSILGPIGGMA